MDIDTTSNHSNGEGRDHHRPRNNLLCKHNHRPRQIIIAIIALIGGSAALLAVLSGSTSEYDKLTNQHLKGRNLNLNGLLPELCIRVPSLLIECEGDCNVDADCEGSLVCYQRFHSESVPGCSGEGTYKTDYCVNRPDKYLFYVFDTPENADQPLGLCEGDCDDDDDCKDDLICFQRADYTAVPGCDGMGRKSSDYCYEPASVTRSTSNLTTTSSSTQAASTVVASTQADSTVVATTQATSTEVATTQAASTEVASTQAASTVEASTTSSSTLSTSSSTSSSSSSSTLATTTIISTQASVATSSNTSTASNTELHESTNEPGMMEACSGDCNDDDDCEGPLMCYQRGDLESVPGCLGTGTSRTDYCADRPPNYLWYYGSTPSEDHLPLKACEGDCDSNEECEGDLICHSRIEYDPVPGCDGMGKSGKDYCREPDPTPAPAQSPITSWPTSDACWYVKVRLAFGASDPTKISWSLTRSRESDGYSSVVIQSDPHDPEQGHYTKIYCISHSDYSFTIENTSTDGGDAYYWVTTNNLEVIAEGDLDGETKQSTSFPMPTLKMIESRI